MSQQATKVSFGLILLIVGSFMGANTNAAHFETEAPIVNATGPTDGPVEFEIMDGVVFRFDGHLEYQINGSTMVKRLDNKPYSVEGSFSAAVSELVDIRIASDLNEFNWDMAQAKDDAGRFDARIFWKPEGPSFAGCNVSMIESHLHQGHTKIRSLTPGTHECFEHSGLISLVLSKFEIIYSGDSQ